MKRKNTRYLRSSCHPKKKKKSTLIVQAQKTPFTATTIKSTKAPSAVNTVFYRRPFGCGCGTRGILFSNKTTKKGLFFFFEWDTDTKTQNEIKRTTHSRSTPSESAFKYKTPATNKIGHITHIYI